MRNRCNKFGFHPIKVFESRHILQQCYHTLNISMFIHNMRLTRPEIQFQIVACECEKGIAVFLFNTPGTAKLKHFCPALIADDFAYELTLPIGSANIEDSSCGLIHQNKHPILIRHDNRVGNVFHNRLGFFLLRNKLLNIHLLVRSQPFCHLIEFSAQFPDFIIRIQVNFLIELAAADISNRTGKFFSREDNTS